MCDGLVEQMTNEEVGKYVRSYLDASPDLAYICYDLNRLSFSRKSRDNHSVILVSFEDGRLSLSFFVNMFAGNKYVEEGEYIPGPTPTEPDSNFAELYAADAKRHGYEGEQLRQLMAQTQASPPYSLPPYSCLSPPFLLRERERERRERRGERKGRESEREKGREKGERE